MKNSSRFTKRVSFIGGMLFYFLLSLLLSSYGNRPMHEFLNARIAKEFLKKSAQYPELKDYSFSQSDRINGVAVTVKGGRNITEGEAGFTFSEWVTHGGFSADEPEWLMALRHFYDPKAQDGGKNHLTDIPLGLGVANPEIDMIEWALEDKGEISKGTSGANPLLQRYSWEDGKRSMILAMGEKDKAKREKLLAHAWRSLGETIHGLGDMACPVHVRNDGHPPGDSDPFENGITLTKHIPENPSLYWDQALLDRLKSSDSLRMIFHELAVYTNENFFTNQTVFGMGIDSIKPSLRPNKPYPKPFASANGADWKYESDEFTFYRKMGNNWIKMCKDRNYFASLVTTGRRSAKAYVDLDVAESQAQVLVSNLIGIGPELIRRFVPKIRPVLDGADPISHNITGTIHVDKTNEYKNDIKYNSWVLIYNKTSGKSVEVEASNGSFNTVDLDFKIGDELQAYVVLGGMQVGSNKFVAKEEDLRSIINRVIKIDIIGGVPVRYNNSTQTVNHPIGFEFCISPEKDCIANIGKGPIYTIQRGNEQLYLEFDASYQTIKKFIYKLEIDTEVQGVITKALTEINLNSIPLFENLKYTVHYASNLSNGTFNYSFYRKESGASPFDQKVTSYDADKGSVNVIFRTP